MKPEWNKLDILARICHSVLVHCQDASVTAYLSSASNPVSGTVVVNGSRGASSAKEESVAQVALKSEPIPGETIAAPPIPPVVVPAPDELDNAPVKPSMSLLLNSSGSSSNGLDSSASSIAPSELSQGSPQTDAVTHELDEFVEVCLDSAAKAAVVGNKRPWEQDTGSDFGLQQPKRIALEG
jgi:hypothetical protein